MKRLANYLLVCLLFVFCNQKLLAQQHNSNITKDAVNFIKLANTQKDEGISGTEKQFEAPQKNNKNNATPLQNPQDTIRTYDVDPGALQVPIGYGRSRSQDELTSAIGIVRSDQLPERSSVINPSNLLFGEIPGLYTLEHAGGSKPPNPTFLIRGKETFRNNTPLIVIDGFPSSSFRRLIPEAIKSVEVLKDAAATAMYGQKAADGVILITTKRGAEHPLQVHASYVQSLTKPKLNPKMVEAPLYARALNEAMVNDGLAPTYSPHEINDFDNGEQPYLYPNVNWFDETLRNYGATTNANATFSGGGNVASYFVALNYAHKTGIFKPAQQNTNYKTKLTYGRFNFLSNLDINLSDNLLLKTDISTFLYDINNPTGRYNVNGLINEIYKTPSAAFPVKLPDGTWGGTQTYPNNPRADISDTGFGSPTAREFTINATLRQHLDNWIKGLDVEGAVDYKNFGSYHQDKSKSYIYGNLTAQRDMSGNITSTDKNKFGQKTSLNYSENFGNQLRFSTIQAKLSYSRNIEDDKLDAVIVARQRTSSYDGQNNVDHRRTLAVNVHYGLNGTYFFDVTGSYAGRNFLPKGERYSFFPAVSAAWLLSNEPFLQDVSFLDRLKLRGSWGIVGSDRIHRNKPYEYGYEYGVDFHGVYFKDGFKHYASFGLPSLTPTNYGVAKSHKVNVGLDATFWSHLDLNADVFYDRRKNILVGSSGTNSDVIGISLSDESEGIVKNKGLEIGLKWRDTIGKVSWHIGGQYSYARNEIVNKNEQYRPFDYLKRTGRQVGQYFGLQSIGFFKDEQDIENSPKQLFGPVKPGDIKYKDQNDDGYVDQYDVVPIGYSGGYPRSYFSASLGLHYKGIGFSALLQGTGQQTAYLNTEGVYWPLRNNNNISEYYYQRRWTSGTASSATLPRLSTKNNANNYRHNSTWLESRAYIELRRLSLSYSLPARIVESLKMNDIKIMAFGRNLYSWNRIPVGSPDRYGSSYPIMRYYSLGFDISF